MEAGSGGCENGGWERRLGAEVVRMEAGSGGWERRL